MGFKGTDNTYGTMMMQDFERRLPAREILAASTLTSPTRSARGVSGA
jgi:hypothetical protein